MEQIKYNKPIQVLDMTIIQVRRTDYYDVFTGIGWKNHRRVRLDAGRVVILGKAHLTPVQQVAISKTIHRSK